VATEQTLAGARGGGPLMGWPGASGGGMGGITKQAAALAAASNEVSPGAQYSATLPSAERAVRMVPVPVGHMGTQLVGRVMLTMKLVGQGGA
jgi:hypothetical protein